MTVSVYRDRRNPSLMIRALIRGTKAEIVLYVGENCLEYRAGKYAGYEMILPSKIKL